jgi:DNA polymerase-3 subunit gamma/tau
MLGQADRDAVFDLLEAVMGGKPAAALAITDRAYERGADLGTILQDLLDLVHTVTRLKSIPGLRDSAELPETERSRGAAIADRLSVPALARAWQLLLKGVGEVENAPDRRAAAEMVLIRLCHLSDLPPPGELVRRLTATATPAALVRVAPGAGAAVASGNGGAYAPGVGGANAPGINGANAPGVGGANAPGINGSNVPGIGGANAPGINGANGPGAGGADAFGSNGGGLRAVANGVPVAEAAPSGPVLNNFRDVALFVKDQREAMLHAHLLHSVHLVRFAPPVIELRTESAAPRDLAPKLAALLSEATNTRWTIALSPAEGEPTLAAQGNAADTLRREEAAEHPLIRAIMEAFPGARIDSVHDSNVDDYGLPGTPPASGGWHGSEMPDFAPPDAEFSDEYLEFDP